LGASPTGSAGSKPPADHAKGCHHATTGSQRWEDSPVAKYDPLRAELLRRSGAVEMTFAEIAELVGELPPSAYEHGPWWFDRSADTTHVQAHAWLSLGRNVEDLDLAAQRVRFSAPRSPCR
jgi:hypothetical protein